MTQGTGDTRFDFGQFVTRLWTGRVTVAACTGVATLLTILYLHTLVFSYTATLTLVPTQSQAQGGVSSQLGSLAAMAGVNLPSSQGSSPFTIYTDALNTRDTAEEIIRRDPDVLPHLFRYEWDANGHRWIPPSGLRHTMATIIKPALGLPLSQWTPPGGRELQDYISSAVKASSDPKRPVISVTYFNPDPNFAAHFLTLVQEATDTVLRRMTLDRSTKYAGYLEEKLRDTQTTDVRQVLVQSLSQQETLLMMSSSNTAFAAQPLGGPVVSMFPVQPRGLFILLAGVVAGFALGCFLAWREVTFTSLWRGLRGAGR